MIAHGCKNSLTCFYLFFFYFFYFLLSKKENNMTSSPKPRIFFFIKMFYKFKDTLELKQFPLYKKKPLGFLSQSESCQCSGAMLLLQHLHSKQSSWWYIRSGIHKKTLRSKSKSVQPPLHMHFKIIIGNRNYPKMVVRQP